MFDMDCPIPEMEDLTDEEKAMLNDLLSILDVVASNRYVTIESQAELNIYTVYMAYRIQQDLYAVCQENGQFRDLSWDDFVLLMRAHKPARMAAVVVAWETLKNFYRNGSYNFDVTEINFNYGPDTDIEGDDHDILRCAQLFTGEEGIGLVQDLLFHAELSQFSCQLNQRTGCSWSQFLEELEQKGPLWSRVLAAFRDALARLDFKPVWRSEKLEELVRQAEAQEE